MKIGPLAIVFSLLVSSGLAPALETVEIESYGTVRLTSEDREHVFDVFDGVCSRDKFVSFCSFFASDTATDRSVADAGRTLAVVLRSSSSISDPGTEIGVWTFAIHRPCIQRGYLRIETGSVLSASGYSSIGSHTEGTLTTCGDPRIADMSITLTVEVDGLPLVDQSERVVGERATKFFPELDHWRAEIPYLFEPTADENQP